MTIIDVQSPLVLSLKNCTLQNAKKGALFVNATSGVTEISLSAVLFFKNTADTDVATVHLNAMSGATLNIHAEFTQFTNSTLRALANQATNFTLNVDSSGFQFLEEAVFIQDVDSATFTNTTWIGNTATALQLASTTRTQLVQLLGCSFKNNTAKPGLARDIDSTTSLAESVVTIRDFEMAFADLTDLNASMSITGSRPAVAGELRFILPYVENYRGYVSQTYPVMAHDRLSMNPPMFTSWDSFAPVTFGRCIPSTGMAVSSDAIEMNVKMPCFARLPNFDTETTGKPIYMRDNVTLTGNYSLINEMWNTTSQTQVNVEGSILIIKSSLFVQLDSFTAPNVERIVLNANKVDTWEELTYDSSMIPEEVCSFNLTQNEKGVIAHFGGCGQPPTTPTEPAIPEDPSSPILHPRMSGGQIAGIVIGCVIGVAALSGVLKWFYLKKRRANQSVSHIGAGEYTPINK